MGIAKRSSQYFYLTNKREVAGEYVHKQKKTLGFIPEFVIPGVKKFFSVDAILHSSGTSLPERNNSLEKDLITGPTAKTSI
jgi:hypothetical protein